MPWDHPLKVQSILYLIDQNKDTQVTLKGIVNSRLEQDLTEGLRKNKHLRLSRRSAAEAQEQGRHTGEPGQWSSQLTPGNWSSSFYPTMLELCCQPFRRKK